MAGTITSMLSATMTPSPIPIRVPSSPTSVPCTMKIFMIDPGEAPSVRRIATSACLSRTVMTSVDTRLNAATAMIIARMMNIMRFCDCTAANQMLDQLGYTKGADGIRMVPATTGQDAQPAHRMEYDVITPSDIDFNIDREFQIVQEGFAECHGLQCGFCTPGMMLTARWLLDHNPDPSPDEIREALSGQVCRCTGYENIVRAVRWAAQQQGGDGHGDHRLAPGGSQ